jgi:hypothetical protein
VRRRVQGRIEVVDQFCHSLGERLRLVAAQDIDRPLGRPLQYIGSTLDGAKGWNSHLEEDSAFLVNLVVSVLEVLFPGTFQVHCFPLCYFASEAEVRLGELLFAFIGDSFHSTGGGFNAHAPGLESGGTDMKDWHPDDKAALWDECRDFRIEQGHWHRAQAAETPGMEATFENASDAVSEAAEGTQAAELVAVCKREEELQTKLDRLQAEAKERDRKKLEELQGYLAEIGDDSDGFTEDCNKVLLGLFGGGD